MRNLRGRRGWVLAGVSLVSFLGCLDLTVVNTAAPSIGADLGASLVQMQVAVNVFVVALSTSMVAAGRLGDRLGRRRVLLAGSALFGLASLGAGLAVDPWSLTACRLVQGLACAVLYTGSGTVVAEAFPATQRGRAIGTLFAVNGLGLAAGPLVGGLVVASIGWRWIFLVNVPLVVVSLVLCAASIVGSRPDTAEQSSDVPGLALLTVAVLGLVTALTVHTVSGWLSWPVLASGVAGVVALVALVAVERRARSPLVPPEVLRVRVFRGAIATEVALATFYTTTLFLMPLGLRVEHGLGALGTGLMMLPATVTVAVLSPVVGRVVDRTGPAPVMVAGLASLAVSGGLQAVLGSVAPLPVLAVAFVLMGVGWSMTLGPAAVAALSAVPSRMSGLAVGTSWTFHNVGGAVGLALGMTVFGAVAGQASARAGSLASLEPGAFDDGYRAAAGFVTVVCAVAAAVVLRVTVAAPADLTRWRLRRS